MCLSQRKLSNDSFWTTLEYVKLKWAVNGNPPDLSYTDMTPGGGGPHGGTMYYCTIDESNFDFGDFIRFRIRAMAKGKIFGTEYKTYKPGKDSYYTINVDERCTGTLNVNIIAVGGDLSVHNPGWSATPGPYSSTYNSDPNWSQTVPTGDYTFTVDPAPLGWILSTNPNLGSPVNVSTSGATVDITYTKKAAITGYIKPDGSEAESSGQWYLTSAPGAKYNDGVSVEVAPGPYTVAFTDVTCWDTPASQTFTVSAGENKTVTGTYTRQTGNVEIDITYDIPLQTGETAGTASIKEQGSSTYEVTGLNDGDTWTAFRGVTYVVEFSTIPYYNTPGDVVFSLSCFGIQDAPQPAVQTPNGPDFIASGEYTRKTGELYVILQTDGVAPGPPGALYTVTGTGAIFPVTGSSTAPLQIYRGYAYTVAFNTITNYDTPPGTGATLGDEDESATVYGNYLIHRGSIQAWCAPPAVNPLGAKWYIVGSTAKYFSSDIVGNLPIGSYNVGFISIDGWTTPFVRTVTIATKGEIVQTVGLYVAVPAPTGSLQVFIEPEDEVIPDGARWRPIVPSGGPLPATYPWMDSGDIVTGLPLGPVGIEFDVAPGWVLPELTGGKIVENKRSVYTGDYVRPLVVHKMDYDGDGLDDLATFDKKTGKWSVVRSGVTVSPALKNIMEQKYGKNGDIAAPGDYDGDGMVDLAYYREKTGLYRINLEGADLKINNFGKDRDIPVPGDYDGDGATDAALYRPTTGEWIFYALFDQAAPGGEITTFKFGWFGTVPVPGDYDADGRTDLAVYDVKARTWHLALYKKQKGTWVNVKTLKTPDGTFEFPLQHGEIGNLPIHADYSGDRTTDFAIYRRSDSTFNVYKQYELQVGREGDFPIPNDWAGLGRVIPAVYRSANGRWIAVDNLLNTRILNAKHGQGTTPLVSGR